MQAPQKETAPVIPPDELEELARAYVVGRDASDSPAVQDMVRHEMARIERAFDQLTRRIQVAFTPDDPYPGYEAMRHDVLVNRRMLVYQGD